MHSPLRRDPRKKRGALILGRKAGGEERGGGVSRQRETSLEKNDCPFSKRGPSRKESRATLSRAKGKTPSEVVVRASSVLEVVADREGSS